MCKHRTRAGKNAVLVLALGLAFCLATAAQAATTWRVTTTGGNNSGADWTTNASSLQHALATAVSGDQIWVKAGTYLPTATADRTQTFTLIAGVSLYGGFAGTETNLYQRNWTSNVTILSGDIGTVGVSSDNSYHVVTVTTGGTIDGFTISSGNATGAAVTDGGGILSNSGSNFSVANCIILNNTAPTDGGGIYSSGGTATVTGCTFQGNTTGGIGGGLWISGGVISINSSQFVNNSAASFGGGFANSLGTATLNNCMFLANTSASNGGGGVAAGAGSTTTVFNSTFNANQATGGGLGGAIDILAGGVTITNSILWGDTGGEIAGTATVTYSDVQGGFAGTGNINSDPLFVAAGSNLHLQNTSPCIDKGTGTGATAYDIEGNGRVDVPTIANSGGGAPNYVDMGAYENQGSFVGQKVYVNAANTSATKNGQSWATAFSDLQSALAVAGATAEIWVAAGTYTPTEDATLNPAPVDAHTVTFLMKKGVAIRGGFLGTETAASQRSGSIVTTLSGAIIIGGLGANCYHVVTANGETDISAILDSFTITGGSATGGSPNDSGGAIFVNGGSPYLTGIMLLSNAAANRGGGFYVLNGAPSLVNLSCSNNQAPYGGAGCFAGGSATLNGVFQGNITPPAAFGGALAILPGSTVNIGNSLFSDNVSEPTAFGWGGGIYVQSSTLTVSNCTFASNSAFDGGGIYAGISASVTVTACAFTNNSALSSGGEGGAVYCSVASTATLTNCIFSGNSSITNGGSLASYSASPISLMNCSFNANAAATNGGAIYLNTGTPMLTNCILWGDSATTGPEINGTATVTYSCVQGTLVTGTGNINTNPLFTSAANLQLQVASPCIDTGTATGAPTTDILGVARPQGAGFDMGAYELPDKPIIFSSAAAATPNPAGVGQTVTFSSAASGGWVSLTYKWAFGDGATGAGASTTHAYAAAGSFTATVTATDVLGASNSSTVTVTVVAPVVGTGTDSTGDGFSDSFEAIAGVDPTGMPITAAQVQKLSVLSTSIKLNFAKPGNDAIGMSGLLLIPDGFNVTGQKVIVDIGGVVEVFTLGAKGVSPKGNNLFAVGVKATKGVIALQVAKYAVKLMKGSFAAALAADGLVNATTSKQVTIPVTLIFNGNVLQKNVTLSYKASKGKSGAAK